MPLLLFFYELTYIQRVIRRFLERFCLPHDGYRNSREVEATRTARSQFNKWKSAHVAGPKTIFIHNIFQINHPELLFFVSKVLAWYLMSISLSTKIVKFCFAVSSQ